MDPDPAIFITGLQDINKTIISKFFCLLLLKLHSFIFSKIKIHKEVTKQFESRFFSLFLLDDKRDRIRIRTSD